MPYYVQSLRKTLVMTDITTTEATTRKMMLEKMNPKLGPNPNMGMNPNPPNPYPNPPKGMKPIQGGHNHIGGAGAAGSRRQNVQTKQVERNRSHDGANNGRHSRSSVTDSTMGPTSSD